MGTLNRFADAWRLRDGSVAVIRPATAADAPSIQALVRGLTPTSRYSRFFSGVQELSPEWLARFTRVDPRGDVSLLATVVRDGRETLVGMAQYAADPYPERCDFAVLVADAWQGRGIGKRLLRNLECVARAAGIERIEGEVLTHNSSMLGLAHAMGYGVRRNPESALFLHVSLPLPPVAEQGCSPLVKVADAAAATA
jgi:GNAT superfamily N-acetyltransferase